MTSAVDYKAPRVVSQFMQSNARTRVINGPFGSGKSSGCIIEIVRRCAAQRVGRDGYRRSRWAVVRNTMPQLRDTTLKSWFSWFPDGTAGWWKETGKTYYLEFGDVRAEIIFRALDDASDVKNLLSLELTGAWLNEAREVAREIVEGIDGRIDRYPAKKDGGASWVGIMADTNPPEEGSYWWAMMEGLNPDDGSPKPNSWDVYHQPPGLLVSVDERGHKTYRTNTQADNVENLNDPDYYLNLSRDKSDEYVKVYALGKYGTSKSGKPVHPLFNESIHKANDILIPNKKLLLVVSADFGLTPAITLKQQDVHGRVLCLDEIVTEGMGLKRAIKERLKPLLRNKYDEMEMYVTGDPAGNAGAQTDERSCVDIFREEGFKRVKFAYSNSRVHRINATDSFLSRMTDMGPAYLVSPQCAYLIRGMKGGYHYKVNKFGITADEPEKNIYSHICFVAGTMVSTPAGKVGIETLRVGDMVSTPIGPRCVVDVWCRPAEVMIAYFSDRELVGTPDHPVFTSHGFVPLAALQHDDSIGIERDNLWNALFRLHRAMKRVAGTRMGSALFTVIHSLLAGILKRKPVRLIASKHIDERHFVYGVSVEGAKSYYADGVLVSNCESGQYSDMYFEKGSGGSDVQKEREIALAAVRSRAGSYTRRT